MNLGKALKNIITDDDDYHEITRTAALVSVIGIALLILSSVIVAILGVILKVAETASIVTALGVTIGTVGTIVLYRAVASFGEKKKDETEGEGK